MITIDPTKIESCVACTEANIRAELNRIFVGEQFEIFLGLHASDGPIWRVFDAERNKILLSVEAPAAIWMMQDGTVVFIPDSWWNSLPQPVQEIVL